MKNNKELESINWAIGASIVLMLVAGMTINIPLLLAGFAGLIGFTKLKHILKNYILIKKPRY